MVRQTRKQRRYTRRQRGGVEPVFTENPLHRAKKPEIVRQNGTRRLLAPPAKKRVRIANGHLKFEANAANFPNWNPELGNHATSLRKGAPKTLNGIDPTRLYNSKAAHLFTEIERTHNTPLEMIKNIDGRPISKALKDYFKKRVAMLYPNINYRG
jgi:hypothetical protein